MNLLELGNIIRGHIKDFLDNIGVREVDITLEVPSRIEYGEIATSISFKVSKEIGGRPLDIANNLRDFLVSKNIPYIDVIEVAGSGYVNFKLNKNLFFKDYFREIVEDGLNVYVNYFGGKYYRIEYTSVNPNKALHIGHARNVILGSSLATLLKNLGNKVDLLNYIDDTGVQMADIIIGFLKLGFEPVSPENMRFDKYCGDVVYVKAVEEIEKSDELKDLRRKIIKYIEEGDNPIAFFSRALAQKVLSEQLKTCWRLGAYYNLLVWESDIVWSGLYKELFKLVDRSSGRIIKIDSGKYAGTVVIKVSEEPDFNPYQDEVIMRSDGTLTYAGKDLIFAIWKLGLLKYPLKIKVFGRQPNGGILYTTTSEDSFDEYIPNGCDLLFNVIGIEQTKPQKAIKEAITDLYGDEYASRYIHYSYSLVKLSGESIKKYFGIEYEDKAIRMSGRRGIYFNVDDVLDKMVSMVLDDIKESNPDLSDEEAREIAEKISVATLKYSLLSIDRDKEVIFDIDKALDIRGESGAYILYSYVRAKSILEKAGYTEANYEIDFSLLNDDDYKLARQMMLLPLYIYDSIRKFEIKPLVNYMYKLSTVFNEYYEKNPVLKADEPVRSYRLVLVNVFRHIMEITSKLTNIELVDRM